MTRIWALLTSFWFISFWSMSDFNLPYVYTWSDVYAWSELAVRVSAGLAVAAPQGEAG